MFKIFKYLQNIKMFKYLKYLHREAWLGRSHTTSALEEVAREAKEVEAQEAKEAKEAEEREKRSNVHFRKKLPKDAEASNILVGEVSRLGKME